MTSKPTPVEDDRMIAGLVRRAERELLEALRVAQRSTHPRASAVRVTLARITASLGDVGSVASKYASDSGADPDSISEDERASRWREKRREEREKK